MRFIFLWLFVLFTQAVFTQNYAVSGNEKLVFTASYNMSGILTDIAQVTMQTSTIETSGTTLLRLKCTAATYKNWDSFFKIRDLYESYVNPSSLTPYLYKRDILEGSYTKFMEYKYNHKENKVKSLLRKKRKDGAFYEENKTLSLSNGAKDIVATLYKLRTLDFSKAPVGKTKTLLVLFDNVEHPVTFTYLGTESIATALGKKTCHKLAISMNNTNVLKGNRDNLLWLTADENKVPVYVKFKIPVGNGELKIKSVSGLKN